MRLFDWVWQTSAKVSILIICLLMVKFVLKNKISPRLHYLLWSIVIVSLLLPWTPQTSFSLYNFSHLKTQQATSVNESTNANSDSAIENTGLFQEETGYPLDQIAGDQNQNKLIDNDKSSNSIAASTFIHKLLLFLWLIGIVVFIIATGLINKRFNHRIQGQSVIDTKLLIAFEEAKNKLNIKVRIPLVQTRVITSPSLYGVFRPSVLIPMGTLEEFNQEQLDYVFVHELLHFKRKDMIVNCLTRGLLIIHWFNPLLWYSFYKLREDQEIACDAITLEKIGGDYAKEYAYTLIKLAERNARLPRIISLASLSGSSSQIRRRITMIKDFRKIPLRWALFVVGVVVVLTFVTMTNAKADTSDTLGTTAAGTNTALGQQTPESDQTSSIEDGSFNYNKYLSFKPSLPSYTAGYELMSSQITCNENTPPGTNSNTFSALYGIQSASKSYGIQSAIMIKEARPGEMFQAVIQRSSDVKETKTQIQIGDLPATLTVTEYKNFHSSSIQFTKDNVEYIVYSNPGGEISLDELKKIAVSINISADTSLTDISIIKTGKTASDELSFKTLKPEDIAVPQGYSLKQESSSIQIRKNEKFEVFHLYYTNTTSYLDVQVSKGNYPFDVPARELKPLDYNTKEINGTEVKLRKTLNMDPAAQFNIGEGIHIRIFTSELQESEVEKVVTSILQSY
ncbi:M56 family metallopeptidase [Desulfitobacterium sp. Sab5]|uniref:M56 family metallopeptidase n=1 Tax=Desulfitobacterium nosdiversum TaxID=3375356 RepID=UPI003CE932CC